MCLLRIRRIGNRSKQRRSVSEYSCTTDADAHAVTDRFPDSYTGPDAMFSGRSKETVSVAVTDRSATADAYDVATDAAVRISSSYDIIPLKCAQLTNAATKLIDEHS